MHRASSDPSSFKIIGDEFHLDIEGSALGKSGNPTQLNAWSGSLSSASSSLEATVADLKAASPYGLSDASFHSVRVTDGVTQVTVGHYSGYNGNPGAPIHKAETKWVTQSVLDRPGVAQSSGSFMTWLPGAVPNFGGTANTWQGYAASMFASLLQDFVNTIEEIKHAIDQLAQTLSSIADSITQSRKWWKILLTVLLIVVTIVIAVAVEMFAPEITGFLSTVLSSIVRFVGALFDSGAGVVGDTAVAGIDIAETADAFGGLGDIFANADMIFSDSFDWAEFGATALNWLKTAAFQVFSNGTIFTVAQLFQNWIENGSPFKGWNAEELAMIFGFAFGIPILGLAITGLKNVWKTLSSADAGIFQKVDAGTGVNAFPDMPVVTEETITDVIDGIDGISIDNGVFDGTLDLNKILGLSNFAKLPDVVFPTDIRVFMMRGSDEMPEDVANDQASIHRGSGSEGSGASPVPESPWTDVGSEYTMDWVPTPPPVESLTSLERAEIPLLWERPLTEITAEPPAIIANNVADFRVTQLATRISQLEEDSPLWDGMLVQLDDMLNILTDENLAIVLTRLPVEALDTVLKYLPDEALGSILTRLPSEALGYVFSTSTISLVDMLITLTDQGLETVFTRLSAEPLANVLYELSDGALEAVLTRLPAEVLGAVFERLSEQALGDVLTRLSDQALGDVLARLPVESLTNVLMSLTDEEMRPLFSRLPAESLRAVLTRLAAAPPGNMLTPVFVLTRLSPVALGDALLNLPEPIVNTVFAEMASLNLVRILSQLLPNDLQAVLARLSEGELASVITKLSSDWPAALFEIINKLPEGAMATLLERLPTDLRRSVIHSLPANVLATLPAELFIVFL